MLKKMILKIKEFIFEIMLIIYMGLPLFIIQFNMDESQTIYAILILGFIPLAFELLRTNGDIIKYKFNSGMYKIVFSLYVTPMAVGCTYFRVTNMDYNFNSSTIFMFLAAYFFLIDGISDILGVVHDKGYYDLKTIEYEIDVYGTSQKLRVNYRKEILRRLLNRYVTFILLSTSTILIGINYIYLSSGTDLEKYFQPFSFITIYILYVCICWIYIGAKSIYYLSNAICKDNYINDFTYDTWNKLITISKNQERFIRYGGLFVCFIVLVVLYVILEIIISSPMAEPDMNWIIQSCIQNIFCIIITHSIVQLFLKLIFKLKIV